MADIDLESLPTTRQAAKASGSKLYFPSSSCTSGHVTARWTRNGECLECGRARSRESVPKWRAKQPPEKLRAKAATNARLRYQRMSPTERKEFNRERSTKDREQRKVWIKRWKEENRAHVTAYTNAYKKRRYHADPEKARAKGRRAAIRRRARQYAAPCSFTAADIDRLMVEQDGRCATPWCRVDIRGSYDIDHKTPLVRGGSNWPDNLALLCTDPSGPFGACNARKHDKTWAEWLLGGPLGPGLPGRATTGGRA